MNDRPDPIDELLRSGASAFPEAPAPGAARLGDVVRTSRRRERRAKGAVLAGASVLVAGGAAVLVRDQDERVAMAGDGTTTSTSAEDDNPVGLPADAWALVCGVGVPPSSISSDQAYVLAVWTEGEPDDLWSPGGSGPAASEEQITTTAADAPIDTVAELDSGWDAATLVVGELSNEHGSAVVLGGVGDPGTDPVGTTTLGGAMLSEPVTLEVGYTVVPPAQVVDGSAFVVAYTTVGDLLDLAEACAAEAEDPEPTVDPAAPTTTGVESTTTTAVVPTPTTWVPRPGDSWPGGPACQAPIGDEPGTVAIWVSNQSFEEPSIGLVVYVDGEVVAEDTYDVEGQHTWIHYEVPVGPGFHEVVIETAAGDTPAWNTGAEAGNGVIAEWWGASAYDDGDEATEPVSLRVVEDCTTVGFD